MWNRLIYKPCVLLACGLESVRIARYDSTKCDPDKKDHNSSDLHFNGLSNFVTSTDFHEIYKKVKNPNTPESIAVQFAGGYVTGYAIKKSMKVAVVTIGSALCFLQYHGVMRIDEHRIKEEFNRISKLLNDKDGAYTLDTAISTTIGDIHDMRKPSGEKERGSLLGVELPPGAGFIPGAVLGFKKA